MYHLPRNHCVKDLGFDPPYLHHVRSGFGRKYREFCCYLVGTSLIPGFMHACFIESKRYALPSVFICLLCSVSFPICFHAQCFYNNLQISFQLYQACMKQNLNARLLCSHLRSHSSPLSLRSQCLFVPLPNIHSSHSIDSRGPAYYLTLTNQLASANKLC